MGGGPPGRDYDWQVSVRLPRLCRQATPDIGWARCRACRALRLLEVAHFKVEGEALLLPEGASDWLMHWTSLFSAVVRVCGPEQRPSFFHPAPWAWSPALRVNSTTQVLPS